MSKAGLGLLRDLPDSATPDRETAMRDKAAPSFGGVRTAKRLHEDVEDAGHKVCAAMTHHLQEHARRLGWPERAIGHLYTEYADGGYHPRYHHDGSEIVERLEYGDLTRRANPALRTWALQSHEHASDLHDVALRDAIVGELF